ncbi:UNVERIFIED_CONTAM: hypothetical protein RMT77_013608 [Armadillidium vulgare]
MKTPVKYIHEDILTYVQKHYVNPPQDVVVDPISADDIECPKWRHISEWEEVTELIKLIFKDVENGTFVEIGSGSGDVMSMTSWLEKDKLWRGLLVEPNPLIYKNLRRRRESMAANLCVSRDSSIYQTEFWIPKTGHEIEEPFKTVAETSGREIKYVDKMEIDQGTIITVQCLSLKFLLISAFPQIRTNHRKGQTLFVHFFVIDTNGGEEEFLESILALEWIQVGVFLVKTLSSFEKHRVTTISRHQNLTILYHQNYFLNYIFLVNKNIVSIKDL